MVYSIEERELKDLMVKYLGKLKGMAAIDFNARETQEWKSIAAKLKEVYHKLININPVHRYHGQEISEVLHPYTSPEELKQLYALAGLTPME